MILNSIASSKMINGTEFTTLLYSDVQNNQWKQLIWNYTIDEIKKMANDATQVAM